MIDWQEIMDNYADKHEAASKEVCKDIAGHLNTIAAANERIRELEEELDKTIELAATGLNAQGRKLTAEREISAKLEKALLIAKAFCNELTAEECRDTVAIPINDALAEVATLRGTEHAAKPSHGKPQCIGYVTGGSKTITDAPQADHSQPVFIIPKDAMEE